MGEFAKRANEALREWEQRLSEQELRLRKHVPSSRDEAVAAAVKRIKQLRDQSFSTGYVLRRMQREEHPLESSVLGEPGDVPRREMAIRLPTLKQSAFGAVVAPAREALEDLQAEAANQVDVEMAKRTRTTTDPSTLPWYYPAAATVTPQGFLAGYRQAEQEADDTTLQAITERMNRAKQEFEQALQEEYSAARGKSASAGELIDGLAQAHVKSAEGELNQALGTYLALAALLGQGAHGAAFQWAEKRDPKRQQVRAMRDAIRQRMRLMPPAVQVEPEEMPLADKVEL